MAKDNKVKIKFEKVKDKDGKSFNKPHFEKKSNGDIDCYIPTLKLSGGFN